MEKESEALEIIEKATDEKAFDQLMEDFGSDSEDAGVVTKNSALDDNLKDKLSDLSQVDKDGVYSQAIKLSDDNYAVVYLYDTAHKNTDGITSALASDGEVQEKAEGAYLKQYHFDVYDDLLRQKSRIFLIIIWNKAFPYSFFIVKYRNRRYGKWIIVFFVRLPIMTFRVKLFMKMMSVWLFLI